MGFFFQHQQFISEVRLQETFNDLLDIKLATVTFNNVSETMYDKLAEFDNEVLSKIQTTKDAEIFARVRGFISASRKQGWNVFESIQQVIRGYTPFPA